MSDDLLRIAKKVAAALRDDDLVPPRARFCDVGWPRCTCRACQARWVASKIRSTK